MKISVIVIAYNIENYISKCLESLISQSLREIEIIVINDGSEDSTLLEINKFIEVDKRIKVVNKCNGGPNEARQCGLKEAQGKYILFVDGDDWLEKDCLSILYGNAEKNQTDIVLYNAYWSYDTSRSEVNTYEIESTKNDNYLEHLFRGSIMPSIWSKFIKRDYIIDNNIDFPSFISYGEDLAFVTNLFISNPKVSFEEKNLYNYYQRSSSLTKNISDKILEINTAIIYIRDILDNNDMYHTYIEEFNYMIYTHLLKYKVLDESIKVRIHKDIYDQYKSWNINVMKNKYIKNEFNNLKTSMRLKVFLYDLNYNLGYSYDRFIKILKIFF